MTTAWTSVDSTNYLKIIFQEDYEKWLQLKSKFKITNNRKLLLTSKGFDQENSAPDSANDTQSTGVPEWQVPLVKVVLLSTSMTKLY